MRLVKKLNLRKASGHDKISSNLLKMAGPYIYETLTDLFNLSINLNGFPSDWKTAKVFPLFLVREMMQITTGQFLCYLLSISTMTPEIRAMFKASVEINDQSNLVEESFTAASTPASTYNNNLSTRYRDADNCKRFISLETNIMLFKESVRIDFSIYCRK